MQIIPMEPSEMPRYVQIFRDAFRQEPWKEDWSEEDAARRLSGFMSTGTFYGLSLVEDGESVGFILGQFEPFFDGMRFYIQEFCCAKRGGGYGTALMAELERQLKARGVMRTDLLTVHGELTEGFYARRGYQAEPVSVWMYKKL